MDGMESIVISMFKKSARTGCGNGARVRLTQAASKVLVPVDSRRLIAHRENESLGSKFQVVSRKHLLADSFWSSDIVYHHHSALSITASFNDHCHLFTVACFHKKSKQTRKTESGSTTAGKDKNTVADNMRNTV